MASRELFDFLAVSLRRQAAERGRALGVVRCSKKKKKGRPRHRPAGVSDLPEYVCFFRVWNFYILVIIFRGSRNFCPAEAHIV